MFQWEAPPGVAGVKQGDLRIPTTLVCYRYLSKQKFTWIDYEEKPATLDLQYSIIKSSLELAKKSIYKWEISGLL